MFAAVFSNAPEGVSINPSATVKVAIIDTGSNLANEAYSVIGDDTADYNGHGTDMAAYILNETSNAYIISIKALGNDGQGDMSNVYAAVQMAENLGVDYILMAISIRNIGKYDAFIDLIKNTKATVVASAGNNDTDAVKYLPAGINGVIAVGALNTDGTKASFSNYGDSVDYYVVADSTSEASAIALGKIVGGKTSELVSKYIVPDETDPTSDGIQYSRVVRSDNDDNVFITNYEHEENIIVYQVAMLDQADYFKHPYNESYGVYSDEDSFSWDSHILYCIQDTKEAPDDFGYGDRDYYGSSETRADLRMIQVAAACGPTGELYSYAVQWWKDHDTNNEIKSSVKNNSADMKKAMYGVTHWVMCRAYGGEWPSSTPGDADNAPQVFVDYYNWLQGLRNNGSTTIPNVTVSGWWCEVYGCTEFGDEGTWSNAYGKRLYNSTFQYMARGNASKTESYPVGFTIDKTGTVVSNTSLAGVQYTLYRTCTDNNGVPSLSGELKTFTLNASGAATSSYSANITSMQTYYIKETKTVPGYELDDTVYMITLSTGGNIAVYSIRRQQSDISVTGYRWVRDTELFNMYSNGTAHVVHFKDVPDAKFSLAKSVGSNDNLKNVAYSFELWTGNTQIATGTATVTGTSAPVTWTLKSGLDETYQYADTAHQSLFLEPGTTYMVMETVTTVNGSDLKTPTGWTKGTQHNKTCFYYTWSTSAGSVTDLTITNAQDDFKFSITKVSDVAGLDSSYKLNATYTLYNTSDANGNTTGSAIGTFVCNDSGVCSTTYKIEQGKYYHIKETAEATNYELDAGVWCIQLTSSGALKAWYQAAGSTSWTSKDSSISWSGEAMKSPINLTVSDVHKTTNISLIKASTNPGITSSNSCYSLNGTSYGLYSSVADANANTNKLATFTVGADGKTSTSYKTDYNKTYYLKETTAGKGYLRDGTVYKVVVSATGVVTISVQSGVAPATPSVTTSGNVSYLNVKNAPGHDPLEIRLRKIDKDGNVVHNATLSGAVFEISYYAQDLGVSGNNNETATVIYRYTLSGSSATVKLSDLQALTPTGGSDPNYLKNLPADWDEYPYGTIRIKEVVAPAGYMLNDQVIRIRLGQTGAARLPIVENVSAYSNKNYWNQQADETLVLTEQPKVGYYALTKSLDDTTIRSSVAGFEYELYNTSSQASPVLIATGVSQADGRVLWTYKVADYYSNKDNTKLLTNTTTYELELPATEKNSSGNEVAIQYQVREIKSSIAIAYGNAGIPYTSSVPKTNDIAWNNATDYYYKSVTVPSDDSVKREGVVNNYEYTGVTVTKGKPVNDTFDLTKVKFYFYNTDSSTDKLIATGTVDASGNITWTKEATSGYGVTPRTSVGTISTLPLGHYKLVESWDKTYIDLDATTAILIADRNNTSDWVKTETRDTYSYSLAVDLSVVSNDEVNKVIGVENETEAQWFNMTKTVTTAGDAGEVYATLYMMVNGTPVEIANGVCNTTGAGTFNFTWSYSGQHKTVDGKDTILLPVGSYRVVESCPVTYYGDTAVAYTYMTPAGFTARTVNGNLEFFKDFNIVNSETTINSQSVTNTRIEGSFSIIKCENSGTDSNKTFTFRVYYRGNGTTATGVGSDYSNAALFKEVRVTTVHGEGSVLLDKLPEGWYEVVEVNNDNSWTINWTNPNTVSSGNKVVRVSSNNRTNATPTVDDGVKVNGTTQNAVLVYNDVKPEIRTTLVDSTTNEHVTVFGTSTTLKDTVSYSGLKAGNYELRGVLINKQTGQPMLDTAGNQITGVKTFTISETLDKYGYAVPQSGTQVVSYTVDTTVIKGVTLVAYEELYFNGVLIAYHKNINDAGQTVDVPEIHTVLLDASTNEHLSKYSETTVLNDTVTYSNLIPGKSYTMSGTLVSRTDNGTTVTTGSTTFTPSTSSGSVVVQFTIDSKALAGKTVVAYETLTYGEYTLTKDNNIDNPDETVYIPDIKTTLVESTTNDKVVPYSKTVTLKDTVTYTNLIPNKTYKVSGELMDKNTGNSLGITASKEFTPSTANGTVELTFSIDATVLTGKSIVAFETVTYNNVVVAVHAEINDVDQTVYVPEISTSVADDTTHIQVAAYKESCTLTDTVTYKNLVPNKTYTLSGVLMDKKTGQALLDNAGRTITASTSFRPTTANGTATVTFTFNTTLVKDVTIVVYETLKFQNITVAVHTDINDAAQTLYVPEIQTTLTDDGTSEHVASAVETLKFTDVIKYTNLLPGKEYKVSGELYDVDSGEKILVNGQPVTGETTFTPSSANGTVNIKFELPASVVTGVNVVAFEDLYYNGIRLATHADITDKAQMVNVPEIHTTLVATDTNEHVTAQSGTITLVDTVTYKSLRPNLTYKVSGVLMDKATGEKLLDDNGEEIVAEKTFKPTTPNGTEQITFEFDASVIKGVTVVAFETVTYNGKEVAVHADINDLGQTVDIPDIGTKFFDSVFDENNRYARQNVDVTLTDRVYYTNLRVGLTYTITGTVMVKGTENKPLLDADGHEITASKTFKATTSVGYVDIEFTVNTSLVPGKTLVAFETLSYGDVKLVVHADINDNDQTVYVPDAQTIATDKGTEEHYFTNVEKVDIVDVITYKNLKPDNVYEITGTLMNAETGEIYKDSEGNTYVKTVEFTPETQDGTTTITFTDVLVPFTKTTVVVFEDVYDKTTGIKVVAHADLDDEDQTVRRPEIHTTLIDVATSEHVAPQNKPVTLTDTVAYDNLIPNKEYTMNGVLMDKATGEKFCDAEGNPITATKTFTPEASSGIVELTFEFDASLLNGATLVAFEELQYNQKVIATHNDISDLDQTVDIPGVRTTFFDKEIGLDERTARAAETVTLVDRVYYTNIKPGLEYTLYGSVMVKETGEPFVDAEGNAVVATKTFVPETADGYEDIEFTVNTLLVAGQTLVAFETLDYNGVTLVIHADIEDEDQTVHVPEIATKALDSKTNTQTLTYSERVTVVDTVEYKNLIPNKDYVVHGVLYNADTGEIYTDAEGKTYEASTEFTAETPDGFVEVIFKDVLVPFTQTKIVVFEDLEYKSTETRIATHADIEDEDQTVHRPTAATYATADGDLKVLWLANAEVRDITITDTIKYTGFEVGKTYRAEGTLQLIRDGKATPILVDGKQPLKTVVEFVPTEKDGEITVEFVISTKDLAEGDKIVVFEQIFDVATEDEKTSGTQETDILIAKHEDLSDEDQTITIHFRPMTGGVVPTYAYVGAGILLAVGTIFGVQYIYSRKRRKFDENA